MGLSELIARTKSALSNDSGPTKWNKDTPVPAGFSSNRQQFQVDLASFSTLVFESRGLWARGTIEFKRGEKAAAAVAAPILGSPPGYDYDDAPPSDEKGQRGKVHITVETRWNEDTLKNQARVSTFEKDYDVGLRLETSDSKVIAADMSFHISVVLPSTLTSLNELKVVSARFRVIVDPSLGGGHTNDFTLGSLDITTSDAPIILPALSGIGTIKLRNVNELDPRKRSIQCFDDLVTTTILDSRPSTANGDHDSTPVQNHAVVSAESVVIDCFNGAISGSYTTTRGALDVRTTNFPISGTFRAYTTLSISTTNASITGVFSSETAAGGITVDAQQARIDGEFKARGPISVLTRYAPVTGNFVVGKGLVIKTSTYKVEATVELMEPVTLGASRSTLGAPPPTSNGTPAIYFERRPSIDPPPLSELSLSDRESEHQTGTSPTQSVLSFASNSTSMPPTFEQAIKHGARPSAFTTATTSASSPAAQGSSSGSGMIGSGVAGDDGVIKVDIETTEGQAIVEYVNQPRSVTLISSAQSTGGAKVSVKHPRGWTGSFMATTNLISTATVNITDAPANSDAAANVGDVTASASTSHSSGSSRLVHYTKQKRSDIAGTLRDANATSSSNGSGSGSRNRTSVVGRGPVEIIIL